jgi:hypothetical protein
MKNHVVSAKIDSNLYQRLKSEVGVGQISRFIENLLDRELSKQEQSLAKEYQEASQDKKR